MNRSNLLYDIDSSIELNSNHEHHNEEANNVDFSHSGSESANDPYPSIPRSAYNTLQGNNPFWSNYTDQFHFNEIDFEPHNNLFYNYGDQDNLYDNIDDDENRLNDLTNLSEHNEIDHHHEFDTDGYDHTRSRSPNTSNTINNHNRQLSLTQNLANLLSNPQYGSQQNNINNSRNNSESRLQSQSSIPQENQPQSHRRQCPNRQVLNNNQTFSHTNQYNSIKQKAKQQTQIHENKNLYKDKITEKDEEIKLLNNQIDALNRKLAKIQLNQGKINSNDPNDQSNEYSIKKEHTNYLEFKYTEIDNESNPILAKCKELIEGECRVCQVKFNECTNLVKFECLCRGSNAISCLDCQIQLKKQFSKCDICKQPWNNQTNQKSYNQNDQDSQDQNQGQFNQQDQLRSSARLYDRYYNEQSDENTYPNISYLLRNIRSNHYFDNQTNFRNQRNHHNDFEVESQQINSDDNLDDSGIQTVIDENEENELNDINHTTSNSEHEDEPHLNTANETQNEEHDHDLNDIGNQNENDTINQDDNDDQQSSDNDNSEVNFNSDNSNNQIDDIN